MNDIRMGLQKHIGTDRDKLLQSCLFLAERIIVIAELFGVEAFWIDTEAF